MFQTQKMSKFLQGPHSIGLSNNLYRNYLIYLLEVEGNWLDPISTCVWQKSQLLLSQLAEGNTQNAFAQHNILLCVGSRVF